MYLNEEKILMFIGKGKRNIFYFSNVRDRVFIGWCDNGLGSW